MSEIALRLVDWAREADPLRDVRRRVFIEEQHVPEELEWDDLDARCIHALASADGKLVGTGRLTPDGYIGRMAVLPDWRGRAIGARLLRTLMDIARERGDAVCRLHAQTSAMPFYEKFGFQPEGEEFMDAGIPHRTMWLRLAPDDEGRALEGHEALAAALTELAGSARHEFALYAPDLAPRLTDNLELAAALRRLALSSSRARIRILCRDAREAARGGHALLRLAAAVPSRCAVQQLDPEDEAPDEVYAFVDRRGALHQPRAEAPTGLLALAAPRLARDFAERFNPLWERSRPEPEARRLQL